MRVRLFFGVGAAILAAACAQSDAGITTSIKSQLAADDMVRARNIDVDTRERVVTLNGEVRSAEEESKALQIARNTNGVANVIDQIEVVPETAPTTGLGTPPESGIAATVTDAGITAEVKSKLLADPDTSGLRINVDTSNGVVTLTGTVRTQAAETEALAIAGQVKGVASVTDQITVEARR
jgi:hyperosmotically inducible periplasmic protein